MTTSRTPAPEPEIYNNVPLIDYLRWDCVSFHALRPLRWTPAHARHEDLIGAPTSDALRVGEAFHACMLEPDRFDAQYVEQPVFEGHPNSNRHKDAKAQWLVDHHDSIVLTKPEFGALNAMYENAMNDEEIHKVLTGKGSNELSVVWRDEKTGLKVKTRVDRFTWFETWPTIAELKTSRDISDRGFPRECAKYDYHLQSAMQLAALDFLEPGRRRHFIVAFENKAPFLPRLWEFGDAEIRQGQALMREYLDTWAACEESGVWPGYESGIHPLELPDYALTKVMRS